MRVATGIPRVHVHARAELRAESGVERAVRLGAVPSVERETAKHLRDAGAHAPAAPGAHDDAARGEVPAVVRDGGDGAGSGWDRDELSHLRGRRARRRGGHGDDECGARGADERSPLGASREKKNARGARRSGNWDVMTGTN